MRRRSIASLGELLFYFCNCDAPANPSATWPTAESIVQEVARLLGPEEDAVARHYAAKAVDNLMTGEDFWAQQFKAPEIALALLEVCSHRPGALYTGACSTPHRYTFAGSL